MPIDFLAGEKHFLDHLYPIWEALPPKKRGSLFLVQVEADSNSVPELSQHAARHRYAGCRFFGSRRAAQAWLASRPGPLVVASVRDDRLAEQTGRPVVFCEHGAGQTYDGAGHPSYAGGRGRNKVVLFLCPNQSVAERNLFVRPQIPAVVVGCPKLDQWHRQPPKLQDKPPTLAVGWHWDCRVCSETRWAFPLYRDYLPSLLTIGPVLGHGHPRVWRRLAALYPSLGIEPVEDFAEVVERADLYICDNSSTLFEFASLNRPVVVINAPWYRRTIHHGLRFWEAASIGVQVEHPSELTAAVKRALLDEPEQQQARAAGVALAYAYTDGRAAERAAQAILALK